MPKPSVKSSETDALRILMISRGISPDDLAAMSGVKTVTIRDAISQNFPTRRLRLIVEMAVNAPIWSDPAQFRERQDLASRCGFDPFALSTSEIRRRLAILRIRGRSNYRRKAQLIKFLQAKFPPPTIPKNEKNHDH